MPHSPKFQWADCQHALLTKTTAMSCWSWSLPAEFSCPGMVARDERDICHGCYAQIGFYTFDAVAEAQAARYAWTRHCLRTAAGRRLWIDTMVRAISQCATNGYFRWHDSGDCFSAAYTRMIREVCKRTSDIKHWIPTRSWRLAWGPRVLRTLHALPNVVVHPSAISFGDSPPTIEGLGKGSTAHLAGEPCPKGSRVCPKSTNETEYKSCEEAGCRTCWHNSNSASFLVHGRQGRQLAHHCTDHERGKRLEILQIKMKYSD